MDEEDEMEETRLELICRTCGSARCYHCQECGEWCWEHAAGCEADPNTNQDFLSGPEQSEIEVLSR